MYVRGHLMWSVPIFVMFVGYLSREPASILLPPLSALYVLLLMVGALFPDVDWRIMRVWKHFGHRNPLTHSVLFPAVLLALWLYYSPLMIAPVTLTLQVFLIGVALHLFEDNIKTGNLVWIGTRHETYWYFLQGGLTLFVLYLTGFFKV